MSKRINWKAFKERIPARVQVGARRFFEIVWVQSFSDPSIFGETRFSPDQIALRAVDSEKEICHTYYHELLHAFSDQYEVGLTEAQVMKLEKALHYILKDGNLIKEKL